MYPATFYQTWKLVVALVFCPLVCMGVMVPGIFLLPNVDWVILSTVFVSLGITIAITLYIVFRLVIRKCVVSPQHSGLSVTMEHSLPFFGRDFFLPWSAVKNASGNLDSSGNKAFVQIRSDQYPGNFILSPQEKGIYDPAEWNLWMRIQEEIATHNENLENDTPISNTGFYTSRWSYFMSILYVVVIVLGVVANLLNEVDGVRWYHFALLGVIGVSFLAAMMRTRIRRMQK